jgi:hypothetical protein
MLKPSRRSVEIGSAKPAIARYCNVVGIDPDNGLNIGIDIGDVAAVVDVFTGNAANTDDIAGGCNVEAGIFAHARIATAGAAVIEDVVADSRIAIAGGVISERISSKASLFLLDGSQASVLQQIRKKTLSDILCFFGTVPAGKLGVIG